MIALLRDELSYRYLGSWADLEGNSNVEEGLFDSWLARQGYTPAQITVTLPIKP